MKTLESKQQLLDSTKRSSESMEAQVKKLRDEALASRKKLEELRRKEQVLERDRNAALAEKEQTERQQIVLKDAIENLSRRYEREVTQLLADLDEVRHKVDSTADKSMKIARVIEERICAVEKERKQLIVRMQAVRAEMHDNLKQFIDQIRQQAGPLLEIMNRSAQSQRDFEYQVLKCRGEVNGLVARIRAYTAEVYGSAN
ncbi:hypothetical protein BX666DRAFT_1928837 [Dichotomocladium elegans]|nr:hypothetical protein BX666DRAFT_1928837 [Dichotomocladium elegans]